MNVYYTLIIFYTTGTFDGHICLVEGDKLPMDTVNGKNKTSQELALDLFTSITNIQDWNTLKVRPVDIVEKVNEINIIYNTILDGRQKLNEFFRWVRISDLQKILSEEDLKIVKDSVTGRLN